MTWQWKSRQGNERSSNNDAAAVVIEEQYFFAIIVDASEKGCNGAELAQYWATENAKQLINLPSPPSCEQIISVMKETHKALKKQFLHNTASYCALLLHHHSHNAWVIQCGDCRLGMQGVKTISWLSNVHTLANALGEPFSQQECANPQRHTLTRNLNAKRFATPTVQVVEWNVDEYWLLCSDGYWAEYLGENTDWDRLEDDASCLEILVSRVESQQSNKSNNCFVYPEKIK